MNRLFIFVTLWLICSGGVEAAQADTIRERCERRTESNAEYQNCIARETAAETGFVKEKACSSDRCIYKLACVSHGKSAICTGSGFTVTYTPAENGNEISIRDEKGRLTKMSQCGTCSWTDYESGPLKDAELRMAGSNIILDIPK